MKQRNIYLAGALFCGLAVATGAFGAHALKPVLLANNRTDAFETAVRYQFYHGLALLVAGILMQQFADRTTLRRAAFCWAAGTLLFSGSLYALSFLSIGAFAFLTPLGGIFFLAGWTLLVLAVIKNTRATN